MKIRLFFDTDLSDRSFLIKNNCDAFHYLSNVLRLSEGGFISIFNKDFEFEYMISEVSKKSISLVKSSNTKRQEFLDKEIILLMPIIKKDKLHIAVQNSIEQGVSQIYPLITSRTQEKFNFQKEKIYKIIQESLEQCNGIKWPIIHDCISLQDSLIEIKNSHLLFGDNYHNKSILTDFTDIKKHNTISCLVGPEGGFSKLEIELINNYKNIHKINIGQRILRTENAISAILTICNVLK